MLLFAMLGIVTGAGSALATPATYVSTSTVLLRWIGPNSDQAITVNIRYLSTRAPTYSLLVERASVLDEAIEQSGVELTVAELAKNTESSVPLNSQTIQIRSRSKIPEHAMRLANATAEALVKEIALEERGASAGKANMDAVLAVRAEKPSSAETPRNAMYIVVGALLGGVLGSLAAIIVDFADGRQRPRRGSKDPPLQSPTRKFGLGHLAWASIIAATIPWRSNTYYENGADPVVIAKAAISLLALVISIRAYKNVSQHHNLPATPMLLISAYLAVTVVGGLANRDISAAVVVMIRVVVIMSTIALLVATYGSHLAARSFIQMLAVLVSLATMSGILTFSGRLGGMLHPNELALATAVVGLWLLSRVLAGDDHIWEIFALVLCITIVFLTGSRSSLAAFGAAALSMVFRITALRTRTLLVIAMGLPTIAYLITGTDLVSSVFMRGGSGEVATLSNRTIAWEAALNLQRDFWQTWFGQGLAQKKIEVPGQWWDTQLLDSSWVSALVQGGNMGVILAIWLGLAVIFKAAFAPRPQGALWLGLALMTTLTGILESGLLDGSLLFIVFCVASLGAFSGHLEEVALDSRKDR